MSWKECRIHASLWRFPISSFSLQVIDLDTDDDAQALQKEQNTKVSDQGKYTTALGKQLSSALLAFQDKATSVLFCHHFFPPVCPVVGAAGCPQPLVYFLTQPQLFLLLLLPQTPGISLSPLLTYVTVYQGIREESQVQGLRRMKAGCSAPLPSTFLPSLSTGVTKRRKEEWGRDTGSFLCNGALGGWWPWASRQWLLGEPCFLHLSPCVCLLLIPLYFLEVPVFFTACFL